MRIMTTPRIRSRDETREVARSLGRTTWSYLAARDSTEIPVIFGSERGDEHILSRAFSTWQCSFRERCLRCRQRSVLPLAAQTKPFTDRALHSPAPGRSSHRDDHHSPCPASSCESLFCCRR